MTLPRGTKRALEVVESLDFEPRENLARKRSKLSAGQSSATTSPQLSEASALVPTDDEGNLAESEGLTSDYEEYNSSGLSTSASSDAGCDSSDDENDVATTNSGSASRDKSLIHDDVDGAGITNLRIGKKPRIKAMEGRRDMLNLRERLNRFLPQIAIANEEIEEQRREGQWEGQGMEDVDEAVGDNYIEMNLGLGVLEHKDQKMSEISSSSVSADNEADSEEDANKDVLAKLMGHSAERTAAGIEEMDI